MDEPAICFPRAAVDAADCFPSPRTVLVHKHAEPVCLGDCKRRSRADEDACSAQVTPTGNAYSGSLNNSNISSFNYVDFIHSKEQIEPVLQSVRRHLSRSLDEDSNNGGVVMLDVRADISGPSKAAAAHIFSCSADADAVPRAGPPVSEPGVAPISSRPTEADAPGHDRHRRPAMPRGETVHFGRL